jgi:hypothetical protein
MSHALDLVVLNGPLEGETVQLRPNEPLMLGRSAKGLQLIDPLVSLNHAEITWEGDRYWIRDMTSATGTFVNDVRLSERAVVLVPGMRIRLGETDLEVRERPRSAMIRVLGVASALLLLVAGVKAFIGSIEVRYHPAVRWYEPIRQGAGIESDILEIPTSFIREAGVDHRELSVDQVSDFDANGIDELWLSWPEGHRLVTFNPDGSWRTLSELPDDCHERGRTAAGNVPAECKQADVRSPLPETCKDLAPAVGFPDLECAGTVYRYDDHEGYRIVEHDGLYVWMPPVKLPNGPGAGKGQKLPMVVPGPPVPYIFTLVHPSNLAGFLAERGVVEPIHYLVCEEALPGMRAQVLTERGDVVPLSIGCIGNVILEGSTRTTDFADGEPRMFAFTGHGYRALLEDLAVYMSGSPDLLFMNPSDRPFYTGLKTPPKPRNGIRVSFTGPERIFDPVAADEPVAGERSLQASEFTRVVPPRSKTVTLTGSGRYKLDGCGEIQVDAHEWHCLITKGCGAQSVFLRVQDVGCGTPGRVMEFPYNRGVYNYEDPFYQGRVAVESLQQDGQIDVLRVRFAYRQSPKAQEKVAEP